MAKTFLPEHEAERMMLRAIDARRDGVELRDVYNRFSQLPTKLIRKRLSDEGLLDQSQFAMENLRRICNAPDAKWRWS